MVRNSSRSRVPLPSASYSFATLIVNTHKYVVQPYSHVCMIRCAAHKSDADRMFGEVRGGTQLRSAEVEVSIVSMV